jgi:RHS repeat-associated protein
MIRKDMGRLPNKTRMENPDVVFAESQSFDYNIRGWWNSSFAFNKLDRTKIQSDGKIVGATANFEHSLSYNFNGNIKEAIWGNALGQDYTYDGYGRLKTAIGKTNTKFSEVLDYDENGNIRSLNRKDIGGTEVDKLTYTYEANSNKLISVADAGTAASYPNIGGNFTYDANGNQTSYLPRGIPTITYNILNLVNSVNITGRGIQNYTYGADGTKLGFRQGYDVKVKFYVGAVEYDGSGGVARIGTEEGYILKRKGWNENSKDSKFVYYYSVKDHLGNVRLVLDDKSNAKLWQRNDYQAFGMHINQPVDGVSLPDLIGINDRYYNGKEFDDQTTWLDYGARQYDYSLNKWMSVDPAHEDGGQESFTPYGYVFDNPMKYTDPDGRCPKCGDFLKGLGQGFVGTFKSIGNAIVHPITTAQNAIASINSNPEGAIAGRIVSTVSTLAPTVGATIDKTKLESLILKGDANGAGQMVGSKAAELTIALASEGVGRELSPAKAASKEVAATTEVGESLVKVRHHTSPSGSAGIKASGDIKASRGIPYGVDVEVAPFSNPSKVNMGQAGRGAYVEFSIPQSQISNIPGGYMGGVGNSGRIVTGGTPLNIQNFNPSYHRNWLSF